MLGRALPVARVLSLLRPPIAHNGLQWRRNINLLSIGYGFRPHLRTG